MDFLLKIMLLRMIFVVEKIQIYYLYFKINEDYVFH